MVKKLLRNFEYSKSPEAKKLSVLGPDLISYKKVCNFAIAQISDPHNYNTPTPSLFTYTDDIFLDNVFTVHQRPQL